MSSEIETLQELADKFSQHPAEPKAVAALNAAIAALSPPSSATPGDDEKARRPCSRCDSCNELIVVGYCRDCAHTMADAATPQPQERAGSDAGAVAWQYRYKSEGPNAHVYNTFVHPISGMNRSDDEIEWWVYGVSPQPASDASGDADLIDSLWQVAESYTDCRIKRDILRAAERLTTLSRALAESRAVIAWVGEVYPATDAEAGGAHMTVTWAQFNAMREAAGFKPAKPATQAKNKSLIVRADYLRQLEAVAAQQQETNRD